MPDPYDWLGIPKAHRPPTHYQLLGIPPAVRDAAQIKAAADRQLKRVQPHLTGPHGNEARILRAEINRARETLLDPEKRAIYDTLSPDVELIEEPTQAPEIDVELVAEPEPAPEEAPAEEAAAEEPAAAAPEPWWKEAPEQAESDGEQPWWKEAHPTDEPGPPQGPAPGAPGKGAKLGKLVSSGRSAKPASAPARRPKTERPAPPVPDPIVPAPDDLLDRRRTGPGRLPVVGMAVAAILVVAAIAVGAYFAFGRKKDDLPKEEPKLVTKGPGEINPNERAPPKEDDPFPPEGPTPKDFSDKLRPKMFRGHQGAVNGVAVARSGLRLYSVGVDKTVRIWSVPLEDVTTRHRFLSPGVALALYDEDRGLAACDSLTVALLDTQRMRTPKPLESPRGGVSGLAVTPNGSKVLTGMTDGYLRLWDTATGRYDEWAVAPRGPIAVAMTPDAATGVAAVAEGPVAVWDLRSHTKVYEWAAHPGGAITVELAPDKKRVVTAGADGTAAVYDIGGKREVCRLAGHAGPVAAAWLADGKQVVTAGTDGIAKLWNAETGLERRWSQRLDGKAMCVAVDPQDRFIIVGTATGTVHLFPLPRVKTEALSGPAAKPPTEPLPVPSPDAVREAMAPVRTELRTEFAYTRTDDVALLADNLRRRAAADNIAPALRFGLLQEARGLAIQAADPVTAMGAVEEMAAWFDLDELAEKATTLNALPPETDALVIAGLALPAAERAEAEVRPEAVERILKRVPAQLPEGLPKDQGERLAALRTRSTAAVAELAQVRQAAATLKSAKEDQPAHHTLGVFLALTRQDWANGLPHVAKGTDALLIEAARADLGGAADPKAQARIGELWWARARDAKDPRHKRALLGRARFWFERVTKAKLEVTEMVKAQARLRDVDNLNVPPKDPTALPLLTPVVVRRGYNTVGADVVTGEWQPDAGAAADPQGVRLPAGLPAMHSRFGLAPGGRLTLVLRPDGREVRVNVGGQEFAFVGTAKAMRIVLERTETTVTATAYPEGEEQVSRTADLPLFARGPTRVTVRVTGVPTNPAGTLVTAATARGATALAHPGGE